MCGTEKNTTVCKGYHCINSGDMCHPCKFFLFELMLMIGNPIVLYQIFFYGGYPMSYREPGWYWAAGQTRIFNRVRASQSTTKVEKISSLIVVKRCFHFITLVFLLWTLHFKRLSPTAISRWKPPGCPGFESRKDRRDDFLCRLLFRYPASHPRVTAVARKDPGQSHSAKSAGGS